MSVERAVRDATGFQTVRLFNHEAEASVLGRIIGDAELLAEALADGVSPATFARIEHRLVFTALAALRPADHAGGITALMHSLQRTGELAAAGGPPRLATLIESSYESADNARWTWRHVLIPLQHDRKTIALLRQAALEIAERRSTRRQVLTRLVPRLVALCPPEACDD